MKFKNIKKLYLNKINNIKLKKKISRDIVLTNYNNQVNQIIIVNKI